MRIAAPSHEGPGRVPIPVMRHDHRHRPGSRIRGGSDRKSTRLNSSHLVISYPVFCLKKKTHERCQSALLAQYVAWDSPHMPTWAATRYVPRLLEIAALADVVVYVASFFF